MPVGFTIFVDDQGLDNIEKIIDLIPKKMRKEFPRRVHKAMAPMINDLSVTPGPVKLPFGWPDQATRDLYLASGNAPYRRTNTLSGAWDSNLKSEATAIDVILQNLTPYAADVQGEDSYPGHRATGWPQVGPTVEEHIDEVAESLIFSWFAVTEFSSS